MNHFYNNVPGFMSNKNIELFNFIIKKSYNNFNWVELGSFKGKSAAYCVVELLNKNIEFKFTCVDLWSSDTLDYDLTVFENNIKPISKHIKTIQDFSHLAAKTFKRDSVDFCYVDADHSYESVMKDLKAWWPKIKPGCYIAGDDYTKRFPGCQAAVKEFFSKKDIKHHRMGRCWIAKKP